MSELKEIRDVALVNAKEVVEQNKEVIQEAYKWVMRFAYLSRREGMLALECEAEFIPKDMPLCDRLTEMVQMVTDGIEPQFFSELLTLKFMANKYTGRDALLYYIYARSMLLIQEGASGFQLEQFINAIIPEQILIFDEQHRIENEWNEQKINNMKNNLSEGARKQLEDISRQLCDLNEEEWKKIVSSYGFYGFDKLLPLLDEEVQDLVATYMNPYRYYTIMRMINAVTEQEMNEMADDLTVMIEALREKEKGKGLLDGMVEYSDRELQELMREVDNQTLTLALKGEREEIVECFFRNLSPRLKYMIQEDMEYMGPVRLREVEEAQRKIVQIASQKFEK